MIRIYVACLASYNAGKLHGAWIDACTDVDIMQEEIDAMLTESPTSGAEEWAIHDHEGFEGIKLGENPDLETVALHARMLDAHDGAWVAYANWYAESDPTEKDFACRFQGEYNSAEHFAEDLVSDTYSAKDLGPLANYIDYKRYARDLQINNNYYVANNPNGGVYVFSAY